MKPGTLIKLDFKNVSTSLIHSLPVWKTLSGGRNGELVAANVALVIATHISPSETFEPFVYIVTNSGQLGWVMAKHLGELA